MKTGCRHNDGSDGMKETVSKIQFSKLSNEAEKIIYNRDFFMVTAVDV